MSARSKASVQTPSSAINNNQNTENVDVKKKSINFKRNVAAAAPKKLHQLNKDPLQQKLRA